MKHMGTMYQITGPHFVAGLWTNGQERVYETAPILKYMGGWSIQRVKEYCAKKTWRLDVVA